MLENYIKFKSDRSFTFFDYKISHGQLLIRSSKNDDYSNNIDIIFYGVKYIQSISSFHGLSIKLVDKKEVKLKFAIEHLKNLEIAFFEIRMPISEII